MKSAHNLKIYSNYSVNSVNCVLSVALMSITCVNLHHLRINQ